MPTTEANLIDRYLHAVKFWLPQAQQQDIIAELAEDLHSQVEEREAALGRPLSEEDLVALLKKRGSPMRVASGYIPEQLLISPAIIPAYRLVLLVVLLSVLAPLFLMILIEDPAHALLRCAIEAWRTGFQVVGVVTVCFALVDRYQAKARNKDTWDPRKLPRVPAAHETAARFRYFASFVSYLAAALFWAFLMWQRSEFVFSGAFRFVLAPVWNHIYWPILGVTLGRAAVDLFSFLYPARTRIPTLIRLGLAASSALLAGLLLTAGNWVEIAGPKITPANIAKAMPWFNGTIQGSLIFSAVVMLIEAIQQMRLLLRATPGRAAQILTTS
jgi:hypothetical protein